MNRNRRMRKKIEVLMLTAAMLGGTMGQSVYAATPRRERQSIQQQDRRNIAGVNAALSGELPDKDGKPSGVSWDLDERTGDLRLTGSGIPDLGEDGDKIPWGVYRDKIKTVEMEEGVQPTNMSLWFSGCWSLAKIPKLPESLTNGMGMFWGCGTLRGAVPKLPESLTNGNKMFYGCRELRGGVPKLPESLINGEDMFDGCSGLSGGVPKLPESLTNGGDMFMLCSGLSGGVPKLPESLINGENMFDGCSGLSGGAPKLPESLTNGKGMFWECSGLRGDIPKLPESLTNGSFMFEGCSGLSGGVPKLPESLTNGEAMFDGCSGLDKIGRWDFDASKILSDNMFKGVGGDRGLNVWYGSGKLRSYLVSQNVAIHLYCVFEFCDIDGKTIMEIDKVYEGEGLKAEEIPEAPEGYHWNAADLQRAETTKLTEDQTIRVQKNEYTVTFKDGDGNVIDTQKVEYEEGAKAPAAPGRTGYTFTGWDKDFSKVTGDLTVTAQYKKNAPTPKPDPTPQAPKAAIQGTASYVKVYGSKSFRLSVRATGRVSYKSSNPKVARVSTNGTVSIKETGIATITETAVSGSSRAVKKVTIKVTPKKQRIKGTAGKKKLKASWEKDPKASGYQIYISTNKEFKKAKAYTVRSYKTYQKTFKHLKSKKNYYVRVRAYKSVGKAKLYGGFSSVKKIKVK